MIKKRVYLISGLALLFIVLTVVYFTVISPLLSNTEEQKPLELLEGEVEGSASSILMFAQVERENVNSIEVHNNYGDYYFYYDEGKNDFFFKDHLDAPYSKEMISSLVTAAGFPITMKRVTEKSNDLSEYGLAESDDPAYYVLTTRDNKTHKVYIGNMIPTGAGYYTKYDGRDAVYITESSISQTLLAPVSNLMTPILFLPLSKTDYYSVKDFILAKNGEPFIRISSETKTQKDENGNDYEDFVKYRMDYPAEYSVSTNYDTILQSFAEFYGVSVAEIAKDGEIFSKETLEKYDLANPAYELLFTYNGIKNDILISKKNDDGTYYAYSLLFNIICVMSEENFNFLEWDLIDFVDKPILQYNINDISSITVSSKNFEETFLLYISEGNTTQNKITGATTTSTDLQVKLKSTDKYIENPKNFRYFYMTILSTNLVTYADVENENDLECLATLKLITRSGHKLEISFYPYSTRRCLFKINGKGEFYVLKDSVEKIINDAQKVIKGEPVEYQAKN